MRGGPQRDKQKRLTPKPNGQLPRKLRPKWATATATPAAPWAERNASKMMTTKRRLRCQGNRAGYNAITWQPIHTHFQSRNGWKRLTAAWLKRELRKKLGNPKFSMPTICVG